MGRYEFYEIKPRNDTGLRGAQKKLQAVEVSYRDAGLEGIYRRGMVYPFRFPSTRRIEVKTRFIRVFIYLTNLCLAPRGVSIRSIFIELYNPEAGVLLYKICVEMDGQDNVSKESARVFASFAIRIMSELNTLGETPAVRQAAKDIAITLVPDDLPNQTPAEVQWIIAGRDFRKTPFLQLKPGAIADEVASQLNGIRDAMYSRLMGKPGERYFICADENWYRSNIELPGIVRVRNVARMTGTADLVRAAQSSSLLGALPAMILTANELVLALPLAADALHWISQHPGTVLIIITATVIVTALVLVTAGAAAAPAGLAAASILDLGAGAAAGGLAATESGLMVAPIMTAAAGVEASSLAAVPLVTAGVETVGAAAVPLAGVEAAGAAAAPLATAGGETAAATNLLTLTRTLLSTSVTSGELTAAAGREVADTILVRAMTSPPVQQTLKAGAISAGKVLLPAAALAVVGLCPSRAFAYSGPPNAPAQGAAFQERDSMDFGFGKLFVLRVPRNQNSKDPALYHPFTADNYADLSNHEPNGPKIGKMRMMGSFDVI